MRSLSLALLLCAVVSVPVGASDGTVKGELTLNGKKFPLTHIYGRKREAWPADAKLLGADDVQQLSCGIVELIMANRALSEGTIFSILQNDYKGSDDIRGLRVIIDGSGKYDFETMFLLESGAVKGYGITQSSGSIEGGRRFQGELRSRNEEVTQVRVYEVSFDTAAKMQYSIVETETVKRIPDNRLAEEFLKMLPGEWTVELWVGLGCTTVSGTLVVDERTSPRAFHGTFYLETSKGDRIEEEATFSLSGSKVHVEGGRVSVPETIWGRDVLDLELWPDMMLGNNATATEFVVLRKKP